MKLLYFYDELRSTHHLELYNKIHDEHMPIAWNMIVHNVHNKVNERTNELMSPVRWDLYYETS